MRPYKVIVTIVLLMLVYALVMVPMENGAFPGWVNADIIQFMLLILCVACVLVMIK
jgi:hypothetical protein